MVLKCTLLALTLPSFALHAQALRDPVYMCPDLKLGQLQPLDSKGEIPLGSQLCKEILHKNDKHVVLWDRLSSSVTLREVGKGYWPGLSCGKCLDGSSHC
jgi:hypothetical protein